jgi:hypothetical protein
MGEFKVRGLRSKVGREEIVARSAREGKRTFLQASITLVNAKTRRHKEGREKLAKKRLARK